MKQKQKQKREKYEYFIQNKKEYMHADGVVV